MSWADFPDELLDSIVSHDDANKEYCGLKCRSVCKSWEAVAFRLRYPPYPSPCLMYYEQGCDRWNLFKNNGNISSAEIPELEDAEVLCSKHGCLLMSYSTCDFFIFKLSNNQVFEIARPQAIYKNISFINQPGSSDCWIVGVTALPSYTPHVSIGVLKWGEDEWNHYKHECKSQFIMSDCAPILHRGLLYLLDIEGNIGTFDVENPIEWTLYDKCLEPAELRSEIRQIYFVEPSGGGREEEDELFAVFLFHDERNVNVYKLLEPDMKWKRVVSLGDKILFVGRAASFGGKALFKSEANRIYFPNTKLFYCLDTQDYLPFDGDGNFPHHGGFGFKYLNHATWIDRPPTTFLELFK